MRLDSSVEGERAGGAGGGASRPTPVTMGDRSKGVRGVSDISNKIEAIFTYFSTTHALLTLMTGCNSCHSSQPVLGWRF